MVEAELSKTTTRSGVRIAQTPEEKITAGLQELQGPLIIGLFLLIFTLAGCVLLVGKLGLGDARTSFLEQVSLISGAIFIFIGILWFAIGDNAPSRRLTTQPVLVTGRLRSWSTPSLILIVLSLSVWIGGLAMVFATSYVDLTQGRESSSALRFLSVPQVFGGCLGVWAMVASALETLEWLQDVRRDQSVPAKQAEQEPQLPNLAQTS
jgi:hypothetical protein